MALLKTMTLDGMMTRLGEEDCQSARENKLERTSLALVSETVTVFSSGSISIENVRESAVALSKLSWSRTVRPVTEHASAAVPEIFPVMGENERPGHSVPMLLDCSARTRSYEAVPMRPLTVKSGCAGKLCLAVPEVSPLGPPERLSKGWTVTVDEAVDAVLGPSEAVADI